MSFSDIIQSARAIAIANKLRPDEIAFWHSICREYSKLFSTPLHLVLKMDPEYVILEVYSDQMSEWNEEDKLEEFLDMIGYLKDPDYDSTKARLLREENQKIIEEEHERIRLNKPIHESLVKKEEKKLESKPKEIPKSGGINMGLIKQLQNDGEKGGGF